MKRLLPLLVALAGLVGPLLAQETESVVLRARGWLERLPEELRGLLRERASAVWGDGLLDYLDWRYPAGRSWVRERVDRVVAIAEENRLRWAGFCARRFHPLRQAIRAHSTLANVGNRPVPLECGHVERTS